MHVANSGLPRPIYVHDGKIEVIEATGLPLGLLDHATWDEFSFRTKPGDMFVFFSDGILDASNKKGEMFGRSGVERVIATCIDKSPDCVVTKLFEAVAEFASGVDPFDDQTVLAMKVKGQSTKRK